MSLLARRRYKLIKQAEAVVATAWGAITGTLSDQTDLQTVLDGKESSGTAAAAVAAHEALGDPHPGYLTAAEGAAAYLPLATTLDAVDAPVASVDIAGQQMLSMRIENRTSDPGSPATGQCWLRTDL